MARITEIAPDIFQITEFVPNFNMQFSHYLVRDDESLLFHAGFKLMYAQVREAVAKLIDPSRLRWVSFSHFESDECGAVNEWLADAPQAEVACSLLGAYVNLQDFAIRPPRPMLPEDFIETGKYRFRYVTTRHVPHGWDAGVLFEERQRTLFCSDLFHQNGDLEPATSISIMDRARDTLHSSQLGPFANYVPYTAETEPVLHALAELHPATLAVQHGSCYTGDGAQALRDLAIVMREELGTPRKSASTTSNVG
jgi:flavorubredoxin